MPKTSRTSTAAMPQSERASAKPLACARKVRATIVVAIAIVAGAIAVLTGVLSRRIVFRQLSLLL